MKTARRNLKIGVSGVRGIVGETLSPALAADFAASFGGFAGRGVILVGRDTRPSGVMIENAVAAGLLASGAHVLLAGIVPTPTLQILVQHYDAAGAVAITASHNPAEWNALKFIDSSAFFLTENGMNALLDSYNQPQDDFVEESAYRGIGTIENAFRIHADRIRKVVNVEAIRHAHLKVAVDCCNGVGALYSREFLESLGCEVISIFDETDGVFRRSPEPVAANLTRLCETVRENGCAVGFAQDPDGDRISLVDEQGTALGEQYSILIPALRVLERTPGPVVANVQTTRSLGDLAARFSVPITYSKVGEINVAAEMRAHNAVFGAEGGSGGVLVGVSLGWLLREEATTGGTELGAWLLKAKIPGLSIGTLCLAIDLTIIVFYAAVFRSLENALYGGIALYISTKVMDMVVYGGSAAKLAYIISNEQEKITHELLARDMGVTRLTAEGAYTHNDKPVLLCAVRRREIVAVKRLVNEIDPTAFFIVCDAREVLGEGFGEYKPDGL